MKKLYWVLLVVCLFLAVPVGALAETTAVANEVSGANPVGLGLEALLTNVVFPFLSALLLGIATLAIRWVGKRWHLDFLLKNEEVVLGFAKQGIQLAEEKAAAAVKEETKLTGNQKFDIAVGHLMQRVPKIKKEKAEALVHAALAHFTGVGANKGKIVD